MMDLDEVADQVLYELGAADTPEQAHEVVRRYLRIVFNEGIYGIYSEPARCTTQS